MDDLSWASFVDVIVRDMCSGDVCDVHTDAMCQRIDQVFRKQAAATSSCASASRYHSRAARGGTRM